ncbi:MAG: hypothetical protein IJX25_02545, partial [Clostridia bacterium]|nr:hypothetical protein [Clostridia bacterium]
MRKRIVAIIICSVLSLCFGMSFSSLQSFLYSQGENIPFYQQIAQIDEAGDIEYVNVEKEITLRSLQEILGVEGDNNANIAMSNHTLSSSDVKQWCAQN